jgi:hypothetical protein
MTDPKYVKKAKINGMQVDTIDPMYQQEKATEAFGSLYGSAWGIKNISFTTRMIKDTEIMTLSGVFFYPDGEFEYAVSAKSYYISAKGFDMIDTDAEKKLLTNFRSKCLSLLGFNSDIFLNKFHDSEYVDEAFMTHALCSPEQQQTLRKGLGYYKVNAQDVTKHFIVSTMADIPASKFEEAQAYIKHLGETKSKES